MLIYIGNLSKLKWKHQVLCHGEIRKNFLNDLVEKIITSKIEFIELSNFSVCSVWQREITLDLN